VTRVEPSDEAAQRGRGAAIWTAWLAVIACIALILWLGSPEFSLAQTSRWLQPVLRYLFPDFTPLQLWRAELLVRKSAHVFEYGVLALLTFRALWLSFETLLLRLAAGAVFTAATVASVDEWRQSFTSVRTGTPRDVLIDACGATAAVLIAVLALRRHRARSGAAAATAATAPTRAGRDETRS